MDERTQQEFEARRAQWRANGTDEQQPRLKPVLWSELTSLPHGEPLIKNLWDMRTMSVIYGASGSFKTFVAIDLAAHVALGRCWRGKRVAQGCVLYIATEGTGSIGRRFAAFCQHHGIEPCDDLAVIPVSVDLCHEDNDVDQIIAAGRWRFQGEPIVLTVVDTLSRALAGGNENAPDDMGGFVRNCDRIRQETGAHVCAVHHTGKDAAQGARGHSLLRAAVDTEIEMTKDIGGGLVTATVTKQRDHATGERFVFRPELIELGKDEDEDAVTSYALVPINDAASGASKRKTPPMGRAAKIALDLLGKAIDEAGEAAPPNSHTPASVRAVPEEMWRRYCYAGAVSDAGTQSAKQKAFKRSADALQAAEIIGVWNGWVWKT